MILIIAISCIVALILFAQYANTKETLRQTKLDVCESQIRMARKFLGDLKKTKTFGQILDIHKHAWSAGIHTYQLCPKCSMYGSWNAEKRRREPAPEVENMTLDNIYVGDVFGLFTKTASFWENTVDAKGNKGYEAEYGCNGYGINESIKMVPTWLVPQYRNCIKNGIDDFIDAMQVQKSKLQTLNIFQV